MEHSVHSIRRAFIFHDKFYQKANKILSRAKTIFEDRGNARKKRKKTLMSNNITNSCNGDAPNGKGGLKIKESSHDGNFTIRSNCSKTTTAGDTIFIGVHVR